MHEETVTTKQGNLWKLAPSKGDFIDQAIGWFPSQELADMFAKTWSKFSGDAEKRKELLETHKQAWPALQDIDGLHSNPEKANLYLQHEKSLKIKK